MGLLPCWVLENLHMDGKRDQEPLYHVQEVMGFSNAVVLADMHVDYVRPWEAHAAARLDGLNAKGKGQEIANHSLSLE